jgi:hypothetical protein
VRADFVVMRPPRCDVNFTSARKRNRSRLTHSSRNLPLKLSVTPFCQGLPDSINAAHASSAHERDTAVDELPHPVPLRNRPAGNKCSSRHAK